MGEELSVDAGAADDEDFFGSVLVLSDESGEVRDLLCALWEVREGLAGEDEVAAVF